MIKPCRRERDCKLLIVLSLSCGLWTCHSLRLADKRPNWWKHRVLKLRVRNNTYSGVRASPVASRSLGQQPSSPRFHLVASVRGGGSKSGSRCTRAEKYGCVGIHWSGRRAHNNNSDPLLIRQLTNTSENLPQRPPKVVLTQQQGRDKKVLEVEVLLLKQLCELALRCDGYHWPASLISSRGQNHYSNRLNWFRRKQNQRLLVLAPLAPQTRCGKTEMEKKNVPSVDLKQEQHENNRFERLSVISL